MAPARATFDRGQPLVLNIHLANETDERSSLRLYHGYQHAYWLTEKSSGKRWNLVLTPSWAALRQRRDDAGVTGLAPGGERIDPVVLDDDMVKLQQVSRGDLARQAGAPFDLSQLEANLYTLTATIRFDIRQKDSRWQKQEREVSADLSIVEPVASTREGVRVHDVTFVAIADRVWRVPPFGGKTKIRLALSATNHGDEDVYFNLFDTVMPQLETKAGRALKLDGGRNGTSIPKPVLVKAGETKIVDDRSASLTRHKGSLSLSGIDGTGFHWRFDQLTAGKHRVSFRYNNIASRGVPGDVTDKSIPKNVPAWIGHVVSNPIEVKVAR